MSQELQTTGGVIQYDGFGIMIKDGIVYYAYNGKTGDISTEDLYNALQYSGLVTEEMTAEEMLEVLAEYFPEIPYIIEDGIIKKGDFVECYSNNGYKGGDIVISNSPGAIVVACVATAGATSGAWNYCAWASKIPVNADGYTKLKFNVNITETSTVSPSDASIAFSYSNINVTGLASSWTANNVVYVEVATDTIVEVPINDQHKEIYPCIIFNAKGRSTVQVRDIWLEK